MCRYCQSSTCDTLLAKFARHVIEPGLPDGVVNDPMLEHGFQEASIVEAQTDITAFVAPYAVAQIFKRCMTILRATSGCVINHRSDE